jgi:hypothetical protein
MLKTMLNILSHRGNANQNYTNNEKQKPSPWARGMAQVVERLPGKCKTLSSNSGTTHTKKYHQ